MIAILSNNKLYNIDTWQDVLDIIEKDSGRELADLVYENVETYIQEGDYEKQKALTDADSYEEELCEIKSDLAEILESLNMKPSIGKANIRRIISNWI